MAGTEDKKGQQIFTHEMSPSDMVAVGAVLQSDPKYYENKLKVAEAVNRLKAAGVPLSDTAIIVEFEKLQSEVQTDESGSASHEGLASVPEIEKEPTESVLRARIEALRSSVEEVNTVFAALQRNVHDHFSRFPDPAMMNEEDRMVEFRLLHPQENAEARAFFAAMNKIDFSLNGEIGALYKKLTLEKSGDSEHAAREFKELESICAHDLDQCIRAMKSSEVALSRNLTSEQKKEHVAPGNGDLAKIRRFWIAIERAWKQGSLLQEDLNTRFMKKDEILPEDQSVTTLGRVLEVLESGVKDERRGKISGDFTVDEASKNAQVKLNEGALYFILRNIAYNPLRKGYIGATSVNVRVRAEGDKQTVLVEIQDDGFGIEPDMRERIFEPGQTGTKDKTEGIGMGLAYTDKRLQSMGIGVEIISSRSTKRDEDPTKFGTTFVIAIPIVGEDSGARD